MKNILYILFIGVVATGIYSCSDDSFPVPPASTVPKFSQTIDNDEFAPATVTFKNESIVPERAGNVTYTWNFGDSTSSGDKDPVHVYDKPGAYQVNLVIVTEGSLEIKEVTKTILIKDPNEVGVPFFFTDGGSAFTSVINDKPAVIVPFGSVQLDDSYGIATDTIRGKIYYADYGAEKIWVSNIDGSNLAEFRTNIGPSTELFLEYRDNDASRLYWDTDTGIRWTLLSTTALNDAQNLVTGQDEPEGMFVDPATRTLFWNTYEGGVWKRTLDAGADQPVLATDGGGTIIVVGDRLVFDAMVGDDVQVWSTKFDGSDKVVITTGMEDRVYGLVYDPTSKKVYWGDRTNDKIMRANLDGTGAEAWASTDSPRGFALGKKK